jgi:hypothetical protein
MERILFHVVAAKYGDKDLKQKKKKNKKNKKIDGDDVRASIVSSPIFFFFFKF